MTALVLTWIANTLAIWVAGHLFRGVFVASFSDAVIAGAVLSLVNATVRPVLVLLTLPLTIVTLGLFYFVITAICLWITQALMPGFAVRGAFTTIVASIGIAIISAVIRGVLRRAAR